MKHAKYLHIFTCLTLLLCSRQLSAQINPGDLVINELMAANDSLSGISDLNGDYADWIELHNTTDQYLDLSGYHLSDSLPDPTKWAFPQGVGVEAGGYLIVYADNDPTQIGVHAGFRLSRLGEDLAFSSPSGEVIETVSYPEHSGGDSYSRIPNATGDFSFAYPTVAASNETEPGPKIDFQSVVINEFVASNDSTSGIFDPTGGSGDWIELYNNTLEDIDLGGYFLSDNIFEPRRWRFPLSTIIGARGFLIIWADKDPEEEGIHTSFSLSKAGESVVLTYEDGTTIDSEVYGTMETNVSRARKPNGTGDFSYSSPTFNANNDFPASLDVADKASVKVFPNPANDVLTIDAKNVESGSRISLFDVSGREVLREFTSVEALKIDVSEFEGGQYFVKVGQIVIPVSIY